MIGYSYAALFHILSAWVQILGIIYYLWDSSNGSISNSRVLVIQCPQHWQGLGVHGEAEHAVLYEFLYNNLYQRKSSVL